MIHTYQLTGMTCTSCEAKVKSSLERVENVTKVEVSKEDSRVTISMDRHISLSDFQKVLDTKYTISEIQSNELEDPTKSWFKTYLPILLIFLYISSLTLMIQLKSGEFILMDAMRHFMAGFFLVFSFFKFLNLKGFAESYVMYDVVAKRITVWPYVYAFIEVGLGISFLLNYNPLLTNFCTFIVMSISIIGVLQSVFDNKKIKCACLGAIFNLPMSTVTIIEDALMIVMSGFMILKLI